MKKIYIHFDLRAKVEKAETSIATKFKSQADQVKLG